MHLSRLLLALGCAAVGCVGPSGTSHADTFHSAQANLSRRVLQDHYRTLELDDAARRAIANLTPTSFDAKTHADALTRALVRRDGQTPFTYSLDSTHNAQTAWETGAGDCLSFAHLFVAAARSVGLDAVYLLVHEHQLLPGDSAGSVIRVSHIATGVRDGPNLWAYEQSGAIHNWRSVFVETLSDDEALALHISNLAARRLIHGDAVAAASYSEVALAAGLQRPELYANYSAALMQLGQPREALRIAQDGLEHAPDNHPLLVQASNAAIELGDIDTAHRIGSKLSGKDALRHYIHAMQLWSLGDVDGAEQSFHRAYQRQPNNTRFAEMYARALLRRGASAEASRVLANYNTGRGPMASLQLKLKERIANDSSQHR